MQTRGSVHLHATGGDHRLPALDFRRDVFAEGLGGGRVGDRTFGAQAASIVASALLKSGSAIAKTLFLPDGIRFSGHSHIENDLRLMWDIYTLYDSAPSFLDEPTRARILKAGPPYQPKVEAPSPELKLTLKNSAAVMASKD